MLDLLLAAGLLRLAVSPAWARLATAAAIVLLRSLIGVEPVASSFGSENPAAGG